MRLEISNLYCRIACGLAVCLSSITALPAPLEVYGRLPAIEFPRLSPDGTRLAVVRNEPTGRVLIVTSLADHKLLVALRLGDVKVRALGWADQRNLIIQQSQTARVWEFEGRNEWAQLQVLEVEERKSTLVPDHLAHETDVVPMNVVTGRIMVRRVAGHTMLFVRGLYLGRRHALPMLVRADLTTGRQRVVKAGGETTEGWLVDADGEIAAETSYEEGSRRWGLKVRKDGKLVEVSTGQSEIDAPDIIGFGPREGTLLVQFTDNGRPVQRLVSTQDGSIQDVDASIAKLSGMLEDPVAHRIAGGFLLEDTPTWVFFDASRQRQWQAIVKAFHGDQVDFESASDDLRKYIVKVTGPNYGYAYELVDLATGQADPLGDLYEGVSEPLAVQRIDYTAADGLQIPAYLTLPRGGRGKQKLPLVVLPHGGPAARDTAEFDWWAQAIAEQGYAVLQPNYRGSTLSWSFEAAGFGEFGRKMQSDLSDGVRYLVDAGIADPGRVCVVGASYGGYAALAGVSLQSGVYRCAVAVAGISDLQSYLAYVRKRGGGQSSTALRYWKRLFGVEAEQDPLLDRLSPIHHIADVAAPVLLIHGQDDTVVPFEQSERIYDALRAAGKKVELVPLDAEDHHLSRSATRLQMLTATVRFLRMHNPPE